MRAELKDFVIFNFLSLRGNRFLPDEPCNISFSYEVRRFRGHTARNLDCFATRPGRRESEPKVFPPREVMMSREQVTRRLPFPPDLPASVRVDSELEIVFFIQSLIENF